MTEPASRLTDGELLTLYEAWRWGGITRRAAYPQDWEQQIAVFRAWWAGAGERVALRDYERDVLAEYHRQEGRE